MLLRRDKPTPPSFFLEKKDLLSFLTIPLEKYSAGCAYRVSIFVMGLVAPLLRHNLAWPVSRKLYCHDAEGAGGSAICGAPISEEFGIELWRTGDVRGHSTTRFADDEELRENQDVLLAWKGEVAAEIRDAARFRPVEVPADRQPRRALS